MAKRTYKIIFDLEVTDHLLTIDRKYHGLIRDSIIQQLTHEPDIETRNRKPLLRKTDFDADWEIRFGPDNRFRVFYNIDVEREQVQILAIGVKQGNRLRIAGEEINL